jgi:hypothetical protein
METQIGMYGKKKLTLYKWNCKCGNSRWLPQYELKRIKFCTRKCATDSRIQERIELTCAGCFIKFLRLKNKRPSKSGLYFCSKGCLDKAKTIGGIAHVLPKHYGTREKYKKYSQNYKNQLKENKCLTCSEFVYSEFCNAKCQNEYKYKEYIKKWLLGLESGHVKGVLRYHISKHVRRYMFEKHNNKCQECGWSKINKFTNKIPLQVDHINGDSTNSSLENLRLLCPNCHTLTEFYGSLNKGKGRKDKLEYYYKNKLSQDIDNTCDT